MSKIRMALAATTLVTATALSVPLSTEARSTSEIRSTHTEQERSVSELRTYEGNGYTEHDYSDMRSEYSRTRVSEIRGSLSSHDASPTSSTLPARTTNATPTQPEVKVDNKIPDTSEVDQPEKKSTEITPKPVVTHDDTPEKTSTDTSSNSYMAALANEIHRQTNVERQRAGKSTLRYDNALAAIATKHSQDMAQNNYFSHVAQNGCTLSCRYNKAGYSALAWGENIAWRSSSQLPDAKDLAAYFVGQWMNSDGHRRNILSDNFTHEGIGLAQIGNRVYATANFSNPR